MQQKGIYPAGKDNYFISNRTQSSVDNVIIEGEGETSVIDGNGKEWWPNYKSSEAADIRPGSIIRIKKGSKHLFRNFKITMAPQTNLTLGMSGNVNNVTVHDVWILNPPAESDLLSAQGKGFTSVSHNTDGIPVWANHVNIYNCDINTGDDNIVCDDGAYYIHAWNIKCGCGHGMSVGSNTKNVHDIIYENITFNNTTSGFRIKSDASKSGNSKVGSNGAVRNIICRNATMTGVRNPIKITSWYDSDVQDASTVSTPTDITETTPEFCNITFQNITAGAVSYSYNNWKHGAPVYIYGRPEMKIHDITLDNVQVSSRSNAMYLAYCENVTFKNKCLVKTGSSVTSPYTYAASYSGTFNGTVNSTYDDAGTSPVYFNNGNYTVYTTTVLNGQTINKPSDPTDADKVFLGWSTTKGGTTTVAFPYSINGATTFYAVWEGSTPESGTEKSITWDFSEYGSTNTQVYPEAAYTSSDVDKKRLILNTGNGTNNGSFSDYVSNNGFRPNGTSTPTTRYMKYTPDYDGTLKVSYKSNNGSSTDRIVAIGTSIVTNTDLSTLQTNDNVIAAGASSGYDLKEISAELTTGTTYYIYLAYGGQTITKLTFTYIDSSTQQPESDDNATIEDPDPAPVAVKPAAKKAFDFIVGKDGTINEAIASANTWTGSGRYLIFVPDGNHKMTGNASFTTKSDASGSTYTWDENTKNITTGSIIASHEYTDNAMTWLKKSNVSIIGQSTNGTEIYNIPYIPGISYTSTLEIRSGYSDTYLQDFTLKNLYAGGANDKGVAVAFYDRGTNTILKNVNCWSNQDTYTSAATRCYYETSTFAGTVDFICGSGDVWFEKCDLVINDRTSPNVITAPSTTSKEEWGFVFNSCTINPANSSASSHQGGKYSLGRPWKVAPASTFINTKMNILPSDAAWTNMTSGLTIRFHEYGSTNSSGTLLDLSKRSVSACAGVKADKPVLTAAQASTYKVSSVLGGDSNWEPRALALQVNVSNAKLNGNTLSWDNNDYALCWVVFKNGEYYANPTTNSIALTESGTYTVRAANSMGGLGEASTEVVYTDMSNGGAALAFTAAVQGGSNTVSSTINQETHYYNNWGTTGWAAQAYIGFDIAVPAGKQISTATLKFTSKCGGNYDGRSVDVYLLPKDKTTAFNTNNISLDNAIGTKVSTETDNRSESTKSIVLSSDAIEALNSIVSADATSVAIFQLGGAAAGATVYGKMSTKAPTLEVSFEDIPTVEEPEDEPTSPKVLFSTNFSTADGWSTESIITSSKTTNTKTIKGTTVSFKGYKSSDLTVVVGATNDASGTLTFTGNNILASAGEASGANYYMAIPVTGVNGEITVQTTGDATKWYYSYDDGSNGTIVAREQASANGGFKITGLSSSNVTLYIGSSGKKMNSITITTPVTISEDKDYNTFTEGTYTVKLKRTFDIGKWTTLVLPFDINESMLTETFGTDTEVAEVTKMESDKLYYKNTTSIKANEPVLIKVTSPTADNTYTFTRVTVKNATNATTASADGTQLVGLYKATTWNDLPEELFFLYNGKFYDYSYLNTLRAFRAYILPYEGFKVSAKGMSFMLDDTVTGITSNMDTETESTIYNIAGQRIDNRIKGLHIKNGKKYLVR